jgi:PhzF family phenazine biosynthesis protein
VAHAHFVQADVFSNSPFGGNPVVVILDADSMAEADMQAIARGMNFAETGFVLAPTTPEADLRIRFFTPSTEVPFSGHLTLGTGYVLMTQMGGAFISRTHIVAETGLGLLPVDAEREQGKVTRVVVTEKSPVFGRVVVARDGLADALGLDANRLGFDGLTPQVVTTSLPTLVVPIAARTDVGVISLDTAALSAVCHETGATVVAVFTRETLDPGHTVYVRVFAPLLGVSEDPASGSANAALAAYLVHHHAAPGALPTRISAEQGYTVGRPSLILVDVAAYGHTLQVRVGGRVARAAEGTIYY